MFIFPLPLFHDKEQHFFALFLFVDLFSSANLKQPINESSMCFGRLFFSLTVVYLKSSIMRTKSQTLTSSPSRNLCNLCKSSLSLVSPNVNSRMSLPASDAAMSWMTRVR